MDSKLGMVYTLHRRVTGSSFKASNQEIDAFINQLLASQRFDELADKVAEKALKRLTENDTSLIKHVTTTGKRFTYKQQFRFEEKLRDEDSADFASKETGHKTINEAENEKLHSINPKTTKYGIQLENLKLNYNTLKKQALERQVLTNYNSESNENKSDENGDHKKVSKELEQDISDNHSKNIYEMNRDGFEREFHKNIDQKKHSDEFVRGTNGNMNWKKASEELERDNISENLKKNAYGKYRDRFEIESHENIDRRKHSDEIEHISESHEKSNYGKNHDRFDTGKIHENYQKRASAENKTYNTETHKQNIYLENRDKFERGQGGLKIKFSNENVDEFQQNEAQGHDRDQPDINIKKNKENDVKVHFKSELNEKPTSAHNEEEKQSHLTLIDVENVPITRDYKISNGDASAYKINIAKDEKESYIEVPHKIHSDEITLKDGHENEEHLNAQEEAETPSQQTVGQGKRLIRKERGKFYTYVSRPEYEEFQEELEKQKEIEKIHRRIE